MTDQWTFDESRYEGHTPGPWHFKWDSLYADTERLTFDILTLPGTPQDSNLSLIADAPLILAECVRLHQVVSDQDEMLQDRRRLTRELDVALSGEDGAAEQASLCDLIEQARRLRAIVDRLPKTADGVPVVPDLGDDSTYWRISPKGEVLAFEAGIDLSVGCGHGCCSDWISFSDLYSTKEAAESARKEQGDAAS